MSFQDVAPGPAARRATPNPAAADLLRGAEALVQQIDAQAAAIRNRVEAAKDKLDGSKTKAQVQEAYKMGNQAATFLKQIRDVDPNNRDAVQLRNRLTLSLANLRNVHNMMLAREKKVNAEAKRAVCKAKEEVMADHSDVSDSEATERDALVEANRRRLKVVQMQSEIATNEAIIAEREAGIHEIEAALTEISKIMRDMTNDIQKQGEQLDHIEDHLEQSLAQTKAGTTEVKKAIKQQKRSRKWLCGLLFVVMAVVASIVVYFSVFY